MSIKRLVLTERIVGRRVTGSGPYACQKYDNPQAIMVTVEVNGDYGEDELQIAIRNIASEMIDAFSDYPEC